MRNLIGMGLLVSSVASMGADGIVSQRMEDGRRVYMETCAMCHDSGVHGAPITGQTKQWSDRSQLWEAVLFKHANEGYLRMPGKGGKPELSGYDVDAAAEYMLNLSHPGLPED